MVRIIRSNTNCRLDFWRWELALKSIYAAQKKNHLRGRFLFFGCNGTQFSGESGIILRFEVISGFNLEERLPLQAGHTIFWRFQKDRANQAMRVVVELGFEWTPFCAKLAP